MARLPELYDFPPNFNRGEGRVFEINDVLRQTYQDLAFGANDIRNRQATRGLADMASFGKLTRVLCGVLRGMRNNAMKSIKEIKAVGGEPFPMPMELEYELTMLLGVYKGEAEEYGADVQ